MIPILTIKSQHDNEDGVMVDSNSKRTTVDPLPMAPRNVFIQA